MLRHKFPSAFFKLFNLCFSFWVSFRLVHLEGNLTHRTEAFARPDLLAGSRVGPTGTVTLSAALLHVAHLKCVSSYDSSCITMHLSSKLWLSYVCIRVSSQLQHPTHFKRCIIFKRIFRCSKKTVTLETPGWTFFASDKLSPNKKILRHSKCKMCHP